MQNNDSAKAGLESGAVYLGLELGSTRIKAVLINRNYVPIAVGSHIWQNKLVEGFWTYDMEDIWHGLRQCYKNLVRDIRERYDTALTKVGGIGVSAMMHGYMVFGADGQLLTPFRTWRNTTTGKASAELTGLFDFNIPQRWSIAHLYQAMLGREAHVPQIAYITTLAGYIHWRLTGQKLIGIGDASGMFPIDTTTGRYDAGMLHKFNARAAEMGYALKLEDILPRILPAGENAGALTEKGAALLDPGGALVAGIPLCPPEGDAGTGMAATNSITAHTGNISAGTSVFAMLVLDKALSKVYPEIDIVTTPAGAPVAMVHCNNGSSDIDAWADLFGEFSRALGLEADKDTLYNLLFNKALEADDDCGGLLAYNYFTGEPVTGFDDGRPLFLRMPDSRLTLANFMRTHLFAALGALKLGMDILLEGEGVTVTGISGHGGYFKAGDVGQRIMASALGIPVTVMQTAGEGGPWGMAILAAYMADRQTGETLEEYLKSRVYSGAAGSTARPDPALSGSFASFMENYKKGLAVERAAIESGS